MLQYLLATNYIEIIARGFNYDILKVSQNIFLDISTYVQMVNKPTHIPESLINHVYIKKALMEEFFTNVKVKKIYFSDHDSVRTVTEKNFHINP